MKNQKSIAIVLIAVFAFLLVGTYNSWPKVVNASGGHVHHYSSATCTTPKECDCGETTGEALGHDWSDYVQNSTSTGHYEKCYRCGIKRNEESCKDGTLQYKRLRSE